MTVLTHDLTKKAEKNDNANWLNYINKLRKMLTVPVIRLK
jgi:hypothetical protein